MVTVALTIGGLLALIALLLAVPLTVAFSIRRIERTEGQIRFGWLFGFVRAEYRLPRPEGERREAAPKTRKKAKRRQRRKGGASNALSLIREPAFRRRIGRFLGDLWRATHARDLFLRLRIGLGDPADTGFLWAVVGPMAGMAQSLRSAQVHLEPDFIEPALEVEGRGRLRLVPLQFVVLAAAFLLSPPMLRAWWLLIRERA